MPSIVNFDNHSIIEPGVRSRIIGGVTNPPVQDTFGVVTLIDTGSGRGFGGGSGINGELYANSESVYSFDNITDSQKFLGGGLLYDLMNYFWNPTNGGNGPQRLNIIKAATTTASKLTITFAEDAAAIDAIDAVAPVSGNMTILAPISAIAPTSGNTSLPAFVAPVAPFTGNITIPAFVVQVNATGTISVVGLGLEAGADGTVTQVLNSTGTILLGTYTKITGDNTEALIATALRAAINLGTSTHGFTASGSTTNVILTTNDGEIKNGMIFNLCDGTATPISGATATLGSGVRAVPKNGDIYNVTLSNIILGTYTKTSGETTPTAVATAIRSAVNAGPYGTMASGSGANIVITLTTNFNIANYGSWNGYQVRITNSLASVAYFSTLASGVSQYPVDGASFNAYVGGTIIGSYIKTSSDADAAAVATGLRSNINAYTYLHSFTASGSSSTVTIAGTADMGDSKNGLLFQITYSGGSTSTTLSGGRTASPLNGSTYKLYVGAINRSHLIATYTKTSTENTASLVSTAIRTAINDGTDIHGYTAGGSGAVITLTGTTDMGAMKNGLPVTIILSDGIDLSTSLSSGVTGVDTIPQTFVNTVEIACKNEGLRGNGATIVNTTSETVLSRGYGARVSAGVINTNAFVVTFYEGQYRGKDSLNIEYEAPEISLKSFAICKSIEFTTPKQFIDWATNDYSFNKYFKLPSDATTSVVSIVSSFLTNNSDWLLFNGAEEDYNALDVDAVLESIVDMNNDMFLCDDYGINPTTSITSAGGNKGAQSVANTKILAYIKNTSTYTGKIMFIGGGQDKSQFDKSSDGSLQSAAYFDSEYVSIIHSAIKAPLTVPTGGLPYRELPSLYHAAMVCGRVAGLQPQTPVTYKTLRIKGLKHELSKTERERGLRGGVLHTKYVPQLGWVVNQGINSLQQNDYLIYPSGASPEIQVMRIEHQLNKEIILNGTPLFVGGNRNTVSPEDIKLFIEGLLQGRTATTQTDNLIISFQNITVTLQGTDYYVGYCFVVNSPVNRLFATGVILDPTINI